MITWEYLRQDQSQFIMLKVFIQQVLHALVLVQVMMLQNGLFPIRSVTINIVVFSTNI